MPIKGKPNETEAGNHELRLLVIAKSKNATAASDRRDCIESAVNVECNTLRTANSREEAIDLATRRYAIDGIEARCCRPCYIKIVIEPKSKMVRGNARLKSGEYEDFLG